MTLVEMVLVGVCGLLALAMFVGAIHESWLRIRALPAQVPQPNLADRMIQAAALRCTEEEAHVVIRACRHPGLLADEVARVGCDCAENLSEQQLHRLFMMCCHRTLTRAGLSVYRSERSLLN